MNLELDTSKVHHRILKPGGKYFISDM